MKANPKRHNICKTQTIPMENNHSMAKFDYTFFYVKNVRTKLEIYNFGRSSNI